MKPEWTFAAVLRSRPLLGVLVAALLLGGAGGASAAVINSTWAAGDGNWNVAANWNPAQVPDNNSTDQFSVSINNGATVTHDRLVTTVNALFIDFFSSPASRLFINGNKTFLNESDLIIASGGTLFNGNVLGTNAPGTGVVVLGANSFNAGTILASGGTFETSIPSGVTLTNNGALTASDGGTFVAVLSWG